MASERPRRHRRGSYRARDRAGLDQDQGRADRLRPRADRGRQPTTGRTSSSTGSGPTHWTRSGPGFSSATPLSSPTWSSSYGVELTSVGALGVSAMMHGYLAFDADGELLTPFRTWRNTNTGEAAERLSQQFGHNIPHRWSVAHLYQAILNGEDHVGRHRAPDHVGRLRALASSPGSRCSASATPVACSRSTSLPAATTRSMLAQFDRLAAEAGAKLSLADAAAHHPARRGAGRRTQRSRARGCSTRPGAYGRARRCARPRGTPGPAWSPPTPWLRAPATSAPERASSRWSFSSESSAAVHRELDLVTTPAGDLVAMVHCNNGASELNSWVGLFAEFAAPARRRGGHLRRSSRRCSRPPGRGPPTAAG